MQFRSPCCSSSADRRRAERHRAWLRAAKTVVGYHSFLALQNRPQPLRPPAPHRLGWRFCLWRTAAGTPAPGAALRARLSRGCAPAVRASRVPAVRPWGTRLSRPCGRSLDRGLQRAGARSALDLGASLPLVATLSACGRTRSRPLRQSLGCNRVSKRSLLTYDRSAGQPAAGSVSQSEQTKFAHLRSTGGGVCRSWAVTE